MHHFVVLSQVWRSQRHQVYGGTILVAATDHTGDRELNLPVLWWVTSSIFICVTVLLSISSNPWSHIFLAFKMLVYFPVKILGFIKKCGVFFNV